MDEQGGFCLRWNNHQSTLVSVLEKLLEKEKLVDVTLAADGEYIRAHRLVLCACSGYFEELLSYHTEKHAVIYMRDVPISQLRALLSYMYHGEVNVAQDELSSFVQLADSLRVKGLTDNNAAQSLGNHANGKMTVKHATELLSNPTSPAAAPRRKKARRRSFDNSPVSSPASSNTAPRRSIVDTPNPNVPRNAAKLPEAKRPSTSGLPKIAIPMTTTPETVSITVEANPGQIPETAISSPLWRVTVPFDATQGPVQPKEALFSGPLKEENDEKTIEVEELSLEDNGEEDWSDMEGGGSGSGYEHPDTGGNSQNNGAPYEGPFGQDASGIIADLLQCERCAVVFKQRDWRKFAVHRRYCGLTFRYNCPYCDYGTNTNSNFHRHMRTLHKDLYNT